MRKILFVAAVGVAVALLYPPFRAKLTETAQEFNRRFQAAEAELRDELTKLSE